MFQEIYRTMDGYLEEHKEKAKNLIEEKKKQKNKALADKLQEATLGEIDKAKVYKTEKDELMQRKANPWQAPPSLRKEQFKKTQAKVLEDVPEQTLMV